MRIIKEGVLTKKEMVGTCDDCWCEVAVILGDPELKPHEKDPEWERFGPTADWYCQCPTPHCHNRIYFWERRI